MALHCDNRNMPSRGLFAKIAVTPFCAIVHNRNMMIDGEWIRTRLTGKRGEKARLAEALGVTADVVSKILNGARQVSAEEADKLRAYFGEAAVTPDEAALLAAFRAASEDRRRLAVEFLRLQAQKSGSNEGS